jgi:HEAT repeat protein
VKNFALVLALVLSASGVAAQPPKVVNTQFNTEPAGSGLSATVARLQRSGQPLWLGYEVPTFPRADFSWCSDSGGASPPEDGCCGEYQLEAPRPGIITRDGVSNSDRKPSPVNMYVLLRLDHGAIIKIRPANAGCQENAGGIPFTWLTDVRPDDSVAFLAKLAARPEDSQDKRLTDGALVTLAMHASPAATTALVSLAEPSNPPRLREKSAFWLGAQRGHEGFTALKQLLAKEQDPKLREKLVFDISIDPDPAAIDELLKMAHSDASPQIRGQAIFWLAQKAGKKAGASISSAIENDPDLQVKKKAVFALSQLPEGEGVPQLMHVADSNLNPAIRKEAIFWLGQSKDPRALEYLEAILKR